MTARFGDEYFRVRARFSTALFKGRDISFVKHRFWDRCIRRHERRGLLLDVGCAEGALLTWADKRGYQAFGLDLSDLAVGIAKRRLITSDVIQGDVRSLPLKDNCLDIVTCFDVLEHLEDPPDGLRQVARSLKPGGLFVASVPNTDSFGLKWKGRQWFAYRDSTHVSVLPPDTWAEMFSANGFRVIDSFRDALWDPPYFPHVPRLLQ
ncbi:MAG: class I SAM-dependent methyltransferase, partial [Chloroflexi bacterium]|nr:class I SAM-dependent methyltransferase [Chloroflexota bacterium]